MHSSGRQEISPQKCISLKYFNTESFSNGKLLLLMISKLAEVPVCDELFAQFAYLLCTCSPLCHILLVRMIQKVSPSHLMLKSPALKNP